MKARQDFARSFTPGSPYCPTPPSLTGYSLPRENATPALGRFEEETKSGPFSKSIIHNEEIREGLLAWLGGLEIRMLSDQQ